MALEYFLQTFVQGLTVAVLDSVAYFLDIYAPFAALLSRVTIVTYLLRYKNDYCVIVAAADSSDVNQRISFLHRMSRWLDATFLTGRFRLKSSFCYDLTCLLFAFSLRILIDVIKQLLNRKNQEKVYTTKHTALNDLVLAVCYLTQIMFLFYWTYVFVGPDEYRTFTVPGLLACYFYKQSLLLVSGLGAMCAMGYIIRKYFETEVWAGWWSFFVCVRNYSYLFIDLAVRLLCLYYLGLLYYITLSEELSEIVTLTFHMVSDPTSLRYSIKQYRGSRNTGSRKPNVRRFIQKVVLLSLLTYFLCLFIEYSLVLLDFDLNSSVSIMFLALICECYVYFGLYMVRVSNLKARIYEDLD